MLKSLGRLYSRRIVNVNVNILLANIVAMALTAPVVHYGVEHAGTLGYDKPHTWVIVAFTFFVDLIFDVVLYYGLHWVANHWPRRLHGPVSQTTRHLMEETPKPSFFRDATVVQTQRFALSPVFYLIALGGQKMALLGGMQPGWTVFVGYGSAALVTRTMHTFWMIRSERTAAKRRLAAHPDTSKAAA